MSISRYIHTCIHIHIHVYVYTRVYIYTHLSIYLSIHPSIYLHIYTSTPQLPFKRPHIPSNRDHKALHRVILWGGLSRGTWALWDHLPQGSNVVPFWVVYHPSPPRSFYLGTGAFKGAYYLATWGARVISPKKILGQSQKGTTSDPLGMIGAS